MGRSQVLYNRGKGRNRNRSGRGGSDNNDGTSNSNSNSNSNNKHNKNSNHGNNNSSSSGSGNIILPRQPLPRGSLDSQSKRPPKDYEHEYEVLFAGRDTYLESKGQHQHDDDDGIHLGGTGSICILSMAATLESMSVAQRLKIPLRVAATAFPSRYQEEKDEPIPIPIPIPITNQEQPDQSQQQQQEQQRGSTPAEAEDKDNDNDDASNLEDWLDDACGIDGSTQALSNEEGEYAGGIRGDGATTKPTEIPTAAVNTNTASVDDLLAKAEEEYGDDNLDDWLDSVIE